MISNCLLRASAVVAGLVVSTTAAAVLNVKVDSSVNTVEVADSGNLI
ncbi:hypothetical protein GMORB2_0662 [Geosmithia morbida]|uniref:Uncharacterized protein n=1 Tax=Geosmithia morbida TaxID=1094350 RepID=A0A9P4Z3B0_9HYPO|nr:uncharacterized protein GMORB2_0662 [Geosmithia morbida]KAF4126925.1 hypothetical protein GMORB2_0662 [Geosmithia morbida]